MEIELEAKVRLLAAEVYSRYATKCKSRFKWIAAALFVKSPADDLRSDAVNLMQVLQRSGKWHPKMDAKFSALFLLLTEQHPSEKIIVFTQFADRTVRCLQEQLEKRGMKGTA